MAVLLPTDTVVPAPIADQLSALMTEKSAFAATGAATFDGSRAAEMGGNFLTIPRTKQDTTAAVPVTGSAVTVENVGALADVAPIAHRIRARGFSLITQNVLGVVNADKPLASIVDQTADFWARQLDASMIATLTGLFDSSAGILRTTHRSAIGVASGSAVAASYGALVDGATLLGDNFDEIAVIVAHSKVIANLLKEQGSKSDFRPFEMLGGNRYRVYDNKILIPWDSVPTSGSGTFKKFTTIMAKPGALYFAWQKQLREVSYPGPGGNVLVDQLSSYAAAVCGVKWNVTTTNPADSDLSTATNWAKSTLGDKAIGVVALETNAV